MTPEKLHTQMNGRFRDYLVKVKGEALTMWSITPQKLLVEIWQNNITANL